MKKPQLLANVPMVWQLAADSTYQWKEYPSLVVREALQNSVDAIRKHIKNKDLNINCGEIYITTDESNETLTIRDNGIGMSWDDIQDLFLTLGTSGKNNDDEAAGGFGMAKAIILGSSSTLDWTIKSRDNIIHSHQLNMECEDDSFISEYINGTEITVRNIKNWHYDSVENIEMLLSQSYLTTDEEGKIAVFLNDKEILPSFINGHVMEQFCGGWGENITAVVTLNKALDEKTKSTIVVRLNGLFQWFSAIRDEAKGQVCVIDIHTSVRPTDSEYPFPVSRDSFKGNKAHQAYSKIREYLESEITSSAWENEYENTYLKKPDNENSENDIINLSDLPETKLGDIIKSLMDGTTKLITQTEVKELIDKAERAEKKINAVVKGLNYKQNNIPWLVRRNKNAEFTLDIITGIPTLILWDAIVRTVSQNCCFDNLKKVQFSTGLILDNKSEASLSVDPSTNLKYILLNPIRYNKILIEAEEKRNNWISFIKIFNLACHELAHIERNYSIHDEKFCLIREEIADSTAYLIPKLKGIVEACLTIK